MQTAARCRALQRAGAAPRILQPLLKVIADINITLKLWNKNK